MTAQLLGTEATAVHLKASGQALGGGVVSTLSAPGS